MCVCLYGMAWGGMARERAKCAKGKENIFPARDSINGQKHGWKDESNPQGPEKGGGTKFAQTANFTIVLNFL